MVTLASLWKMDLKGTEWKQGDDLRGYYKIQTKVDTGQPGLLCC